MHKALRSGHLLSLAVVLALACGLAGSSRALAQVVDNPGFKALPRPIHYDLPVCPTNGPQAVIVYGKAAPWTEAAARRVQQLLQPWCGRTLTVTDDRTVTSDATWLLNDAWRKTPLIVLGNGRDNRVMHALGTRFLLQSNRMWPGGDRFLIRTVFEPFVADVNYLVLEASTEAGLNGALARLEELLPTWPKAPTRIPLTHLNGGVKDKWDSETLWSKPPDGYGTNLDLSISEIAADFKGQPIPAGNDLWGAGNTLYYYVAGGIMPRETTTPVADVDPGMLRAMGAMFLNGCRAVGGRTHVPMDHYGAMATIQGLRCLFQTGLLSEQEFNEFENCFTLSGAAPNEYVYDMLVSGSPTIGNRHLSSCLLVTVHTLDYVLNHCRIDDRTRKELERRYAGVRKTTEQFVRSFRDNGDTPELGESTMMKLYAMLHQGLPAVVTNGTLKLSADCYIMTSDNLAIPGSYRFFGRYVGLDSYLSPGSLSSYWCGKGLLAAAAFYYDDPQYGWFLKQSEGGGPWGSIATSPLYMHWDRTGEIQAPARHYGVRRLPFDERLYAVLADRDIRRRAQIDTLPLVPVPYEKAADRITIRDGLDPQDPFLFLATSTVWVPPQNNAIARYTDLGDLWLFHNTQNSTTWGRNVVSISNGKPYESLAGCTVEALANFGAWSMVSTRDHGVGGADWTRTVVHWRGHYFAVLDRVQALADDEFNLVCRWRSPQPASLTAGAWRADAPSGNTFRIRNADAVKQAVEHGESDAGVCPYVLTQFKHARLPKDGAETFQNLLFASGPQRPDEFDTRRAGPSAMLVKGTTAAGIPHLALIGTDGNVPLTELETDAAIYCVEGSTLHLAAVKTLKVRENGGMREVYHADTPVHLTLDSATGKGWLQNPVEPVKQGLPVDDPAPIAVVVPGLQPLEGLARRLEALWAQASPQGSAAPAAPQTEASAFRVIRAEPLRQDRKRLTQGRLAASPAPNGAIENLSDGQYSGNPVTWPATENLALTLTFPEPTDLAAVRLVGIMKRAAAYGVNSTGFGEPHYAADDFRFTLLLSDDGFIADIRTNEAPVVHFETQPLYPIFHAALGNLPAWRIEVGGKARQIRLMPHATTEERATLHLTEVETFGTEPSDEFAAFVSVADIDGDGANELVIGSANKELAAYDADGKRLWHTMYPVDIFNMLCDDIDGDGRAEILIYLTSEELRQVRGDGSERVLADLHKVQVDLHGRSVDGGILQIGTWAPRASQTKDILLWAGGCYRVLPDGSVKTTKLAAGGPAVQLPPDFYPGETNVLATVGYFGLALWSSRCDTDGNYDQIVNQPLPSRWGEGYARNFGWVEPVQAGSLKGVLTANQGSLAWFPVTALLPNGSTNGCWDFKTGGVPVTAALAADMAGDGIPEVFLGRQDGFVNVFNLADGKEQALLNTGEPILDMAMLKDKTGRLCLAVGTKFGVHLFGPDLELIGHQALSAVAFAGPAGKNLDRAYVVDTAGNVTVLVLR